MPRNYEAWHILLQDFYTQKSDVDRLNFLVRFAVLAPSVYNAQPWKFTVRDNEIIVGADFSRSLPVADFSHRLLALSLGMSLENILVAAHFYNYRAQVQYLPNNDTKIFAKIFFERLSHKEHHEEHPIFFVVKRRTNRFPYGPAIPEETFLNWIKTLETDESRIEVVSREEKRRAVGDIVGRAEAEAMRAGNMRREFKNYFLTNKTKSFTGMPVSVFGVTGFFSYILPFFISIIGFTKKIIALRRSILLDSTPLFGIIHTREDTFEQWIKAGQIYERIALQATRNGVATEICTVGFHAGDYPKELQRLIGTSFMPQIIFRMGYSERISPKTPRLPAKMVSEE